MDRREFLKSILITSCLCETAFSLQCKAKGKGPLIEFDYRTPSIEFIDFYLTEHCNFNCKYCNRFSPIADESYLNIDIFERDIKQLAKITGGNVKNISLLGGEPLLHPNITSFFEIARREFPNTKIGLNTNCILLNSMNEKFWSALSKNKIVIMPSIYDLSLEHYRKIIEKAEKYNVYIGLKQNDWPLTVENIEKERTKYFYKVNLDINGNQNILESYERCWNKVLCASILNGKLFLCSRVPSIVHINKKFKLNFEVSKEDYLDIFKITDIKQILDFMKKPIPFCKYCGQTKKMKWETTINHKASEWIL